MWSRLKAVVTSTGQCRRLVATSPSRCRRQRRPSWRQVECRACWAGTSCRRRGSCTSRRPATRCSWTCTGRDRPPETCSQPCWPSFVRRLDATSSLNQPHPENLSVWESLFIELRLLLLINLLLLPLFQFSTLAYFDVLVAPLARCEARLKQSRFCPYSVCDKKYVAGPTDPLAIHPQDESSKQDGPKNPM